MSTACYHWLLLLNKVLPISNIMKRKISNTKDKINHGNHSLGAGQVLQVQHLNLLYRSTQTAPLLLFFISSGVCSTKQSAPKEWGRELGWVPTWEPPSTLLNSTKAPCFPQDLPRGYTQAHLHTSSAAQDLFYNKQRLGDMIHPLNFFLLRVHEMHRFLLFLLELQQAALIPDFHVKKQFVSTSDA